MSEWYPFKNNLKNNFIDQNGLINFIQIGDQIIKLLINSEDKFELYFGTLGKNFQRQNINSKIIPTKRIGYSLINISNTEFLMFGGLISENYSLEPWIFNITNNQWIKLNSISSNLIECLFGSGTLISIYDYKIIYYFGGIEENEISGDLKLIFLNNNSYSISIQKYQSELYPLPRYKHSFINCNGKLYLFGGLDQYNNSLGDLWELCYQNSHFHPQWKLISNSGPQPRYSHISFIKDNSLYIAGGFSTNNIPLYDIWCFNGEWKQISYFDTKKIIFGTNFGLCEDSNIIKIISETLNISQLNEKINILKDISKKSFEEYNNYLKINNFFENDLNLLYSNNNNIFSKERLNNLKDNSKKLNNLLLNKLNNFINNQINQLSKNNYNSNLYLLEFNNKIEKNIKLENNNNLLLKNLIEIEKLFYSKPHLNSKQQIPCPFTFSNTDFEITQNLINNFNLFDKKIYENINIKNLNKKNFENQFYQNKFYSTINYLIEDSKSKLRILELEKLIWSKKLFYSKFILQNSKNNLNLKEIKEKSLQELNQFIENSYKRWNQISNIINNNSKNKLESLPLLISTNLPDI